MPTVIHPLLLKELRRSAEDLIEQQRHEAASSSASPAVATLAPPTATATSTTTASATAATTSSSVGETKEGKVAMTSEQMARATEANAQLLALRRAFFHALSVTNAKQVG
jgi:hypothetical protein